MYLKNPQYLRRCTNLNVTAKQTINTAPVNTSKRIGQNPGVYVGLYQYIIHANKVVLLLIESCVY